MNLEHRRSRRKQLCLEALVFHRLQGLIPATILDINLEGAFIGAERLTLPLHAIVTLTFALDAAAKPIIRQTEAMVIHHARNGCGLLFKDAQFEAFRAVEGMRDAA